MVDVYINKTRLRLNPADAIGKGGEADVYKWGTDKVIKLFKGPDHPDLFGMPADQETAKRRLEAHQKKLKAFPKGLPSRVISPEELVTDKSGKKIIGYVMRFIKGGGPLFRFSERNFRTAGATDDMVAEIFKDLYSSVIGIHAKNAYIGDFNDANEIVVGTEVYLVDTDAWGFSGFPCMMFTAPFVDPLLCDQNLDAPSLIKPHNNNSDWYAFSVILFECLTYVKPYGGVYHPKNQNNKVPYSARPLRRLSVFHPEVQYPKPARPLDELSDSLRQYFKEIFDKDRRGIFPVALLGQLYSYQKPTGGIIAQSITIRGKVKATIIFSTKGVILFSTSCHGKLLYLYHENNQYKREDGTIVSAGSLNPHIRYRIHGKETIFGIDNQLICLDRQNITEKIAVDSFGHLPIFDANENDLFWAANGYLVKRTSIIGISGQETIGQILQGQTLFWVGPKFGFGFYRAGEMSVAFIFDANTKGINDSIQCPKIKGQLLDSICYFSNELCWFFYRTKEGSSFINYCCVLDHLGNILASIDNQNNDLDWLENIRGKTACGKFIFSSTDLGLKKIDISGNILVETKTFPDTEPFVDSESHLFLGKDGIFVVNDKTVTLLTIS